MVFQINCELVIFRWWKLYPQSAKNPLQSNKTVQRSIRTVNNITLNLPKPPKKIINTTLTSKRKLRLSQLRLFEDGVEVLESTPCRDQQRLLLAAESPDLAKPVAAEAEAFAGAVGALGRHKLGLNETEATVKSLGFLKCSKNGGGKMEWWVG